MRLEECVDGGRDGTAAEMPQHDETLDIVGQGLQGVFDAAHADVTQDVARDPDDEQVVESLTEEQLGRHAGVRAADHHRKRRLLGKLALRPFHADLQTLGRHHVLRALAGHAAQAAALHPPREHPVAVFQRFPRRSRVRRSGLGALITGIKPKNIVDGIHVLLHHLIVDHASSPNPCGRLDPF